MSDAPLDDFDGMTAELRFFELVAGGCPPINAAIEVGWTPARLRVMMKSPEFMELLNDAEMQAIGKVENALFVRACMGNVTAMQFYLLNRDPDRWRDVKRIEVKSDSTINLGTVASVKAAVLDLLKEQGAEAMQAVAHPKAIEATATDG